MALLRGRILDAAGRPVAGASVYVAAAPGPMPDIAQLSSADGSFDVEAPVPGRYTIGFAAADGSEGRVTVEVGATDPEPVEVSLRAASA